MFDDYLLILSPNMPHAHNEFETNKIVVALLNAGAHTDIVNNFGENPHTGYLSGNGL